MTFIEAALEVLRREGRPLHSREIAERAVELGLLSHVGKTPVQTMSARLSAAVAKGDGAFIRVRPGVFALSERKPAAGALGSSGNRRLSNERATPQSRSIKKPVEEVSRRFSDNERHDGKKNKNEKIDGKPSSDKGQKSMDLRENSVRSEERSVFPPHSSSAERSGNERYGESSSPSDDTSDAFAKRKKKKRRKKRQEESANRAEKTPLPSSGDSTPARKQPSPVPAVRQDQLPSRPRPVEDAVTVIAQYLQNHQKSVNSETLAQQLGLSGADGVPVVEAMLVADGLDRESNGLRPRFVHHRNGWALVEREISQEIVAIERQVSGAREKLVGLANRQLLRRLRTLPLAVFVRVMVLHLHRWGFGSMVPVDRREQDTCHLSVIDPRQGGRFRTAVVMIRAGVEGVLNENAVIQLRGGLHHYNASSGLIITTGTVNNAARKEADVANLSPIALVDGETLASEMVRLGVGVRERKMVLPTFDEGFFTSLGA